MNNDFSNSSSNIQADSVPSCDNTSTQDSAEEKLFTQTELENLISERLRRERKNQQALIPLKELLGSLREKGFIKNSSYPEMTSELCGHLSTLFDGKKEDSVSVGDSDEQGDNFTESPSEQSVPTITDSEQSFIAQPQQESEKSPCEKLQDENQKEVSPNAKEEAETFIKNDNATSSIGTSDILEMYQKYPDVNIGEVISSPAFLSFSKGKIGNLCEIYSDYLFLTNLLENDSARALKKVTSSLGSTAFGATSRAESPQNTHNLTARQMQIAKSAGLSYREYNELLNSIPKGPRSNHI